MRTRVADKKAPSNLFPARAACSVCSVAFDTTYAGIPRRSRAAATRCRPFRVSRSLDVWPALPVLFPGLGEAEGGSGFINQDIRALPS